MRFHRFRPDNNIIKFTAVLLLSNLFKMENHPPNTIKSANHIAMHL